MSTSSRRDRVSSTTPIWPLPHDNPLHGYLSDVLHLTPRGLCTDVDGTISNTAPTVDAAVIEPEMKQLLLDLAERFDLVATVSGRAVEDQRRLIDIPHIWHVGHHGYEWEELDASTGERRNILLPEVAPYLPDVASALDEIETKLGPRVPGLWMERKGITGGVHWRLSDEQDAAGRLCSPIVRRIAAEHGLRTRAGKLGIELFPPIVTDKGQGLHKLIQLHHLKSVLYLGDDVSDTDGFATIHQLRDQNECEGIAIGVLSTDSPQLLSEQADFMVRGTSGVRALMRWILRTLS